MECTKEQEADEFRRYRREIGGGFNIFFIDNNGQLGLGSFPNSGFALTLRGASVISTAGNFGTGVLVPGSQAGYEGTVFMPTGTSATVSIATAQPPSVTAAVATSTVNTSQVVFTNFGGDTSNHYSIW